MTLDLTLTPLLAAAPAASAAMTAILVGVAGLVVGAVIAALVLANQASVITTEPGDNFAGFFARVMARLADGNHAELMEAMRHDALVMDMLRLDMGFTT